MCGVAIASSGKLAGCEMLMDAVRRAARCMRGLCACAEGSSPAEHRKRVNAVSVSKV